jgi:hypothetical protein
MNYELGTFAGCEINSSILKGYWRLDEGQGTLVTDSSGNGYAGDIIGPGVWVDGYPFTDINVDGDGDGYTVIQGDCNDGDVSVNPGAPEVCDGKENDCNLSTPDGYGESWYGNVCDGSDADLCTGGIYVCADGIQTCTDDADDEVEICDGLDNDCDGQIDEDLGTTTCGIGVCERTINTCIGGEVQTCTPRSPTEFPEITCNDILDNDCDTFTDMSDTDCSESDNAIDLHGTWSQIEVVSGSLPDIANKELTVEAMIKGNVSNLNGEIFSPGVFLEVKDNEPMFGIGINPNPTSTPDYAVGSLGSMLAQVWYHIAGVLTNSAHTHPVSGSCSSAVMAETPHLDIYVNGEFKNCATTSSSFAANPDHDRLYIGHFKWTWPRGDSSVYEL